MALERTNRALETGERLEFAEERFLRLDGEPVSVEAATMGGTFETFSSRPSLRA